MKSNNELHAPSEAEVRQQLVRLTESEQFRNSRRQRRFLSYVVEETLAGRGKHISQFSLAEGVFDRDTAFDPLVDSIVRVEAVRLRSKLAEYYIDKGEYDPIKLSMPKGGYRIAVHRSRIVFPYEVDYGRLMHRGLIAWR